MDISPTQSATVPVNSASGQSGAAEVTSDFETFLRMLTAQIQNQDPLNPVDSSDYAVQLATFSSVEQQVLTNDLLGTMIANMGGTNMSDLARWIGLEAQFGNTAEFDGDPLDLALLPDTRADQSVLVVFDAAANEVARKPVATDATRVTWNGLDGSGETAPKGRYSFSLENFSDGALLSTTPAQRYGSVVEARNDEGETLLVLDDGSLIRATDVTAIRENGA